MAGDRIHWSPALQKLFYMKNYILITLAFLFFSCSNNKDGSTNFTSYADYKTDRKIADSLEHAEDCETKVRLAQKLKTIDFLKTKAHILADCAGKTIDDHIEFSDEKVIDILQDLLDKDQEIGRRLRDSLGSDYTIKKQIYYSEKFDRFIDSLIVPRFDALVDSIGEWPGVDHLPRKPYNPPITVLVNHFPEKTLVKYVKMAYQAAQEDREYWYTVKHLMEISLTRPVMSMLSKKKKYVFPFRYVRIKKDNTIDKQSELTILDFETLSNPRIVHVKGCTSMKYILSSSLSDKKDRVRLLKQAKKILLKQGLEESRVELDFTKQMDYLDYKLFFEGVCI